ncbi:MAG: porin [Sulfuritalea sp.]|nr:porin [Sulfuritalea sp.]
MQKKVIALAVAGLVSGSAFAQSNVTIYGLVDVGVTYVTADGKNSGWAIDNGLLSGSRLGFKGQEDLGNGLKAIFTLEYMLQPDANTGVGAAGALDWFGEPSDVCWPQLRQVGYCRCRSSPGCRVQFYLRVQRPVCWQCV